MCVCVCVSVCVYMDIIVSCMNNHRFLPTTTWLYLEINAASYNEVCWCERHYSVGSLGASGKKMQYHAIWHSIIRHISPFPEREWWQSPHFTFHTSQPVSGFAFFHSSGIFEFITKLISGDVVRRPQRGGNSVPVMRCIKKINLKPSYSEAELWHFT